MRLFPRGKGSELFDFLFGRVRREGEMRVQALIRTAWAESHVPWATAFQERVDTGTPLFCPVVVASKGSSLNHSA
jgi:hypothetical protein